MREGKRGLGGWIELGGRGGGRNSSQPGHLEGEVGGGATGSLTRGRGGEVVRRTEEDRQELVRRSRGAAAGQEPLGVLDVAFATRGLCSKASFGRGALRVEREGQLLALCPQPGKRGLARRGPRRAGAAAAAAAPSAAVPQGSGEAWLLHGSCGARRAARG